MKVTLRRKHLPFIIDGLAQVKGMKDFKKAISLGMDSRALKGIQEETDAAIKAATPENFDALSTEIRDLKAKKAKEFDLKDGELLNEQALTAHVLIMWPKAGEWQAANKSFNESVESIYNEKIEIDLYTELTDKDLPKCSEDVRVAEALSYFMK